MPPTVLPLFIHHLHSLTIPGCVPRCRSATTTLPDLASAWQPATSHRWSGGAPHVSAVVSPSAAACPTIWCASTAQQVGKLVTELGLGRQCYEAQRTVALPAQAVHDALVTRLGLTLLLSTMRLTLTSFWPHAWLDCFLMTASTRSAHTSTH